MYMRRRQRMHSMEEYDGFEYAGLPVNSCILRISRHHNIFRTRTARIASRGAADQRVGVSLVLGCRSASAPSRGVAWFVVAESVWHTVGLRTSLHRCAAQMLWRHATSWRGRDAESSRDDRRHCTGHPQPAARGTTRNSANTHLTWPASSPTNGRRAPVLTPMSFSRKATGVGGGGGGKRANCHPFG
jgi:hypothetical protein